jgi:monoamine oxidase
MQKRHEHQSDAFPADADVIVVGGGIAGLFAAFRLHLGGFSVILLEADKQTGGRVKSRPEQFTDLGLTLDDGANLINSTDTLLLRLMDQFGIPYVRRLKPGIDSMNYLIDGNLYDQAKFDALIFAECRPTINTILADQARWRATPARDTDPKFIDESIASYLRRSAAGPILSKMLKAFFWSEYGYDLENLNLHVLFDYLEIDLDSPCFKLIPNADEAYTVPGGTAQITSRMAVALEGRIFTQNRVTSIAEDNGLVVVEAQSPFGLVVRRARHLFFSAPFHRLAGIKIVVEGISQYSLDEASIASYASGTKLHLKFQDRFEEFYRYSGIILTDAGEQIWPSSTGQGGAGLLTVLTGPMPASRAHAVLRTGRVLLALDKVFPGLSELYVGMEKSDAPMSYSGALRPGEIAHLDLNGGANHWTTIGEASGGPLQGYLEGALRSADAGVTRYILARRGQVRQQPQL